MLDKIPFGDPAFVKALEGLLLEKGIGGAMVEEGIQSLAEAGPDALREVLGAMGAGGGEMAEIETEIVDTTTAVDDGYGNRFLEFGEVRVEWQGRLSEEETIESGSIEISTPSMPSSLVIDPKLVITVPLAPVPTVAQPLTTQLQAPTISSQDRVRAYGFPPMIRLK